MLKTNILFTGFYGYQNTGDDAFVEVASWGARKYWKKEKNRFLARKETLPLVQTPIKGYPFSIPKTYSLQKKLLLNNTNYLMSAGGSTIHSEMKSSNVKAMAVQLKQENKNIKIGGIGVSVGPFKSIKDEKSVQEYLKNIDYLAVRDKTSFDYVSSLDLPYVPINSFDLAALLPDVYKSSKQSNIHNQKEKKIIGISVCQYESLQDSSDIQQEEKRNAMTVDLIKELDNNEDIHFKFYIINGNKEIGDLLLTRKIIAATQPKSYEIYPYEKETKKTWDSISNCDFIISTRMHAAIFACFSNTPFMLNEYHRKCTDFLENIEYNQEYRLHNSDYDIKQRAIQVLEIINDKNRYVVPRKKSEMIEMARLNFTGLTL